VARLAIYVERYTIQRSQELNALTQYRAAAERMGHKADFLFRDDLRRIPEYDACLIRALTDPLNSSYLAARIAQMHGLPVLDDPQSIQICCDKVNMYQRLMAADVRIPQTLFVKKSELDAATARRVFDTLGTPLILKAPQSSFSAMVEKAETVAEFLEIGKRFMRRPERMVAQRFMPSSFDWRVITLDGRVLAVCKYLIPEKSFKIIAMIDGKLTWQPVQPWNVADADPRLLELAIRAGKAIGDGLYGVDLKQHGDVFTVIEVNDNPTIDAGSEDRFNPDLYEKIVRCLLEERSPKRPPAPVPWRPRPASVEK